MKNYFLADCLDCEPSLPLPFEDESKRDEWAKAHAKTTHHRVELKEESR
ncbi:hypothetical protein SEA_BISKIT_49 [Gordonia phage Biskit]|uniref:Uncharacterized protein n=1 Tax=Gordonia phage SketchMex TaxID=2250418 RepID=A0A345KQ45_9CAUD|nr:hypothetical protein SEA_SKETCHMEX_47 [Gordonia phage SketchMex]UVK62088.1 hypothetical protein SEA_BISKIT_49 [Gordonia phage Biskit]